MWRIYEEYAREAKLIQTGLLPRSELVHETIEISFRFLPFSEVGGDFADFFLLPDGKVGIYLGDVVGKGLPAAMYSMLVMGTLRGIHKTGTHTAKVLSLLNERLVQRQIGSRFCTTLYAVFDPARRDLTFSNAGMPLPLRVSGSNCRTEGDGGLPSGMFADAAYGEHVVHLDAGDCVLFATDGIHELCNPDGVEFGAASIKRAWAQCSGKSAQESLDFVFDQIQTFVDGGAPHDDITALVLKVRE